MGFFIQDEAMDTARSAPQGAHYHADIINWGIRRERGIYGIAVKAYTNSVPDQHS